MHFQGALQSRGKRTGLGCGHRPGGDGWYPLSSPVHVYAQVQDGPLLLLIAPFLFTDYTSKTQSRGDIRRETPPTSDPYYSP